MNLIKSLALIGLIIGILMVCHGFFLVWVPLGYIVSGLLLVLSALYIVNAIDEMYKAYKDAVIKNAK